jgi:hypothetical protein
MSSVVKRLQRNVTRKTTSKNFNKLTDSSGDMRVTKNKDGAILEIKDGSQWYYSKLDSNRDVLVKSFRDSSYYILEHMTQIGTVTPNTWKILNIGIDETKAFGVGLNYTTSQIRYIPNDTYIHDLKYMLNDSTAGDYGFRLSRYVKNKGGLEAKINYDLIWESVQNYTPDKGVQKSVPVKILLKAGDLISVQMKVPGVAGLAFTKIAFLMQNRISNK